ncbi:MAG TPA: VOC family protein, partial [Longimicrobiales bacterium]|nr:VOC family protein [Longimicrobiales bacterium]
MSDPKRAQPESFRARTLNISLTVKDLKASVDFYERVVGFIVGEKFERDGVWRAARMVAGEITIMLNQDDGAKGWDRQKGEGISFQFSTAQGVDEVAQRIKDNGGKLVT